MFWILIGHCSFLKKRKDKKLIQKRKRSREMIDKIQDFYMNHPIIFEIITIPIELFVGITLAFLIMDLIGMI